MPHFFDLALSFPVVIFSLLLCLVVIYWLLVCIGMLDLDPVEIDMQAVVAADANRARTLLGLAGVPMMVILTLVSLVGWLVSYFIQLLIIDPLPLGFFYYPLGLAVGLLALAIALMTTALVVKLTKPLLRQIKGPAPRPLGGQVAVVRSAQVTPSRGQALLQDGGAGLLLEVRTLSATDLKRGDRVVLLQYIAEQHAWQVISESEFII